MAVIWTPGPRRQNNEDGEWGNGVQPLLFAFLGLAKFGFGFWLGPAALALLGVFFTVKDDAIMAVLLLSSSSY